MTDQPNDVIRLWPDGPPTKLEVEGPEAEYRAPVGVAAQATMLRNVSDATLTVYRPQKPNGVGIVVCPGGGWRILAWEHEGLDVVKWLTTLGYTPRLVERHLHLVGGLSKFLLRRGLAATDLSPDLVEQFVAAIGSRRDDRVDAVGSVDDRRRPRGRRVRIIRGDHSHIAEPARERERLPGQIVAGLDEQENAHATPSCCMTSTTRGAASAP